MVILFRPEGGTIGRVRPACAQSALAPRDGNNWGPTKMCQSTSVPLETAIIGAQQKCASPHRYQCKLGIDGPKSLKKHFSGPTLYSNHFVVGKDKPIEITDNNQKDHKQSKKIKTAENNRNDRKRSKITETSENG